MKPLNFFDSNGILGQPVFSSSTGKFESYLGSEKLIKEMDHFGIDCTLVSHWDAVNDHPSSGNAKLIEEIKGHNRLFPCWFVIPHHTGEMPEPKKLIKEMISKNVRAVRLFPIFHNFSMEEWSIGPLLKELEKNNILAIVHCPTDKLYDICKKHKELNIVGLAPLRELYPLLEKFDNLYASLEYYPDNNLVEDICRRFGAHRLVFGTRQKDPYDTHSNVSANWVSGPTKAMVEYANITDEEKQMIASGNLKKLLKISSCPLIKHKPLPKLPCPIIDSHFHLGDIAYKYKSGTDVGSIIKTMDIIGVNKLCINSTSAVNGATHYDGNNYIGSICKKYPERFIGFAVINPNFNDTEDEIKRCIETLGLKGIKIHPRIHQCKLSDKKYKPVWEASEKYGIPILSHTGEGQFGSSPEAFEHISGKYPKGIFLLGHSGDNLEGLNICIEIAKKRDNVYLGTSDIVFAYNGILEYTVKQIGADKILFESDACYLDFKYSLGIILYAKISDEDKAKILGLNMAGILKLKH
ncbi:MAG: amidohydrolase family protein [bacterium]|nr:amidohydrolase family protein [bacterium]